MLLVLSCLYLINVKPADKYYDWYNQEIPNYYENGIVRNRSRNSIPYPSEEKNIRLTTGLQGIS